MATEVSFEEVQFVFYSIDRQAYLRLVTEMGLASCQCKTIVAFWNWLERIGYGNFVYNTLSVPDNLLPALVSETTKCLDCLTQEKFPIGDNEALPVMSSVASKDICQGLVYTKRENAISVMASFIQNVCEKPFFVPPNFADGSQPQPSTSSGEVVQDQEQEQEREQEQGQANNNQNCPRVFQNDRTLFVTFSKGHPITKQELVEFFKRKYGGDCIEAIIVNMKEPALYARVVITSPEYIERILGEKELVQFNIYGKDIRIRRYVERRAHAPAAAAAAPPPRNRGPRL